MLEKNLFGTDGVRGLANEYPMTAEMALALARSIVQVLYEPDSDGKRPRVLIGRDTRISCDMIESALIAGCCSIGAEVIRLDEVPTAGVAFLTRETGSTAGIMISASHNPYMDNGIKVFSRDGYKISEETEKAISALTLSGSLNSIRPTGIEIGRTLKSKPAVMSYSNFLLKEFEGLDLTNRKIVLDCANGAASEIGPIILRQLGADIIPFGIEGDGTNINENCGALHPKVISKLAVQSGAALGIALDGDADRCILVDEMGDLVDGDQIIGLCALHLAESGKLRGGSVVVTPMSNVGLAISLAGHGISTLKTESVGDRQVVELMRAQGCSLGGEQSGHIVFLDRATTGDGLLTALYVLEILTATGQPLSELKKSIQLFPQVRLDVRVKRKEPFSNHQRILESINHAQHVLQNKGRVFVRYSGTEPLARVMLEGENLDQIHFLSKNIAKSLENVLN